MFKLAYWAGLFDGEGSVIIQSPRRAGGPRAFYVVRATLGNTHRGVVEEIQAAWGGSRHRYSGTNAPMWTWSSTGVTAAAFLRAIQPWSVIKREQIGIALAYHAIRRDGRTVHPDERDAQIEVGKQFRDRLRLVRKEA